MPSGRSSDRQQRRRGDGSSSTRGNGARRRSEAQTTAKRSGTRAGAQAGSGPRSKTGSRSETAGAFKLSSTRRAALLALLLCAMALSVSVPLRTYLSQRGELAAQEQQRTELVQQVRELELRKAQLSDPERVEAEARSRLGYVRPGETPYIVDLPGRPATPPTAPEPEEDGAWYSDLWKSLTGN
ncbi:septum formation initiator family protein [Saccharopolyspora sp. 7B]|uniref:FtsB family cell division protein n=1 Tax=Saccharopolyspora sp. 7B TaxID=2877240 RepID=UPI001CD74C71|nr:septum formation initiator family protein [Saccharopolyspora sp. 7B]MCA1280931.1 septum formation initiator family protein [Saccharopolyspora sp. 7B]